MFTSADTKNVGLAPVELEIGGSTLILAQPLRY